MKKQLSYSQRLALKVHSSVNSPEDSVTFPYGFSRYATCAAKCFNKKETSND